MWDWKFHTETAASAVRAFHFYLSAVRGGDGFDDRKAKAGAPRITSAGRVDSIEAIEHVRLRLFGNADTIVDDLQERMAVVCTNAQLDPALFGRVLNGIVQQVHHDLFQSSAIAVDHHRPWRLARYRDVFILRQEAHLLGGGGRQF